LIEYETGAVPFWDRELDFRHASFEPGMRVPSFGALLLPLLTEERLSEPAQVKELYRVIALATNRGVAVLTATDLREWALAGSAHSDAEPWALDVEALVVRADLAFLLERYCVARLIGATNPAALYLTPIEARLARALERIGLDARPQVQIGPYTVDFLVQDRVVVECDGAGYHDYRSDRSRDRALEERGYRVLRVSGGEIFRDADSCGSAVLALLNEPYFRSVPPAHDLSASQGPAAVHGEGPAWVAAPAGSGKTRVIEARVNHLLATGIEPKRICAISFTNRAVEEMRSRLPEADAAGVRFTTLHALAKEISELPPHGMRRKLVEGVKSPRGKTRWDILRPILKPEEYRFRRARDLWGDAIRAFRTSYAVPDFADFPEESRPDDVRFLEIHHEYARMLEEGGLTDFEGMVLNAVRSLARDAEFRALVGGRYDYWIVDEFQDLPPGKLALLRLLSSPARNLFVVGDDDQVIYGFAGASPSAFAEFDTAFPDRVERVLAENYRCPHEIVIRSLWLVERNANRISKRVTPMKPLERTEVVTVGRTDDYAELGLEFVTERLAEGYAPHEIALLFRLRDMAVPVERALAGAGVPFSRCSRLSFFTRKTVRSVRAWLRVAAGIGEPLDYVEALEWPTRYLRKATLAGVSSSSEFSQALKSDHDEGLRWLEDWAASLPDSTNRHAVAEFITLVRKTKSKPAPGRILDGLDLRKAAEGEAAPAGEAPPEIVVDIFRRLAEQFRSVEELETWIETRGHDKDYAIGEDEDVASVRARVGRVTLASVHQVKRALDAGRLVHR
jgi:superfamily I DNA/RNA helicase/very-short-patch-repair endonuclease